MTNAKRRKLWRDRVADYRRLFEIERVLGAVSPDERKADRLERSVSV
jgi:hypothetical protein